MKQTVFEYSGYLMRSHSETRWAGMMDALRITWLYEPELVHTRHGTYLPDFYLPHAGVFVEVKGPHPTQIEFEKAVDTFRSTGRPVVIAYGDMIFSVPGISGGRLVLCLESGPIYFSIFEFHSVIRLGIGEEAYKRYLRSGMKQSFDGTMMAGDVMRDMLISSMDRSAREQHLASLCYAINQAKSATHGQPSRAEWGISRMTEKWLAKEELKRQEMTHE